VPLVASALRLTVPILLAALGGVFSERGGVVNIALEGMMIIGTFFGAVGAYHYGPFGGALCAVLAGCGFALIHAVVTVTFRVDQIVSGVALNLLAVGLTRFLNLLIFGVATQSPGVSGFPQVSIPGLAAMPALAALTTGISPLIPLTLLLVFGGQWILRRTTFGLRLRAVGENPRAAESLGIDVSRMRYAGVVISGGLAGLAGAYLALEQAHLYLEGMTQGLGFIALAAVIFGNWWPVGAMGASALFAFFDALSLRVVASAIPYQFIQSLPYVVTILVLAGFVGRSTPPAADGVPYTKGEAG
jgi:general nucleoside transport system permease protein